VIAAGLVVVDRADLGVFAYDAETGAEAWRGAAGKRSEKIPLSTTLAAALGTGTLVVTSIDGVAIVSLADGSQRWAGAPGGLSDFHSPVVVGTRIYVIAGTSAVALDLTD
jgi:outer membrane protein assembly factor BamB